MNSITLEMSLKPFKSTEIKYMEAVCRTVFTQWKDILDEAEMVSVLLWVADGSELLDYSGDLDNEFEWCKYIGGANPRMEQDPVGDPRGVGLHTRNYLYRENPPVFTYRILKELISMLKRVGTEITGKPVRVGETFDPGPEFAKSEFKYSRHNEICYGHSMGKKSMVCSYSVLKKDDKKYAAFPNGIPDQTPFGIFLGKQAQIFLKDLGFDYLWLSNGFGFGTETWGTTGATFDGEHFYIDKMEETQKRIMDFWKYFREGCDFPVEVRGTNFTVGIDLSSDAVNIQKIYNSNLDILPPPNSPWAALDGDFGLELAGYLSRMTELPDDQKYLFRYYIHDPWWMNSPWFDRYERQPHDIYLPLACVRINQEGKIGKPTHWNFLSIDNSLGEMPEQCPQEVIPYLKDALRTAPDAVSPFVWVYPFEEYCGLKDGRLEKPFFEDWFIRGAINHGIPLNTVVSTGIFRKTLRQNPELYQGCIPVTSVPKKGNPMQEEVIRFVQEEGNLILYGSLEGAGRKMEEFLNLSTTSSLSKELYLKNYLTDENQVAEKIFHDPLLSDGGINTVLRENKEDVQVLAEVTDGSQSRVISIYRKEKSWKGAVIWIRGTNCSSLQGDRILTPHNPKEFYHVENLMRLSLQKFGYDIRFRQRNLGGITPIVLISRNDNAFYFSGYVPDTTTSIEMKMPLGAPLLLGYETLLENGYSQYHMPRAFHKECRVFVEQKDTSVISYHEVCPVSYMMRRRVMVTGLQDATVRFMVRKGWAEKTELLVNPSWQMAAGIIPEQEIIETPYGAIIEARYVTGDLLISEDYLK